MNRRSFLKLLGAAAAVPSVLFAAAKSAARSVSDQNGVYRVMGVSEWQPTHFFEGFYIEVKYMSGVTERLYPNRDGVITVPASCTLVYMPRNMPSSVSIRGSAEHGLITAPTNIMMIDGVKMQRGDRVLVKGC